MKGNIKAAILSALVLPGLGQILSGRRLKGWILAVLSVILFLNLIVVIGLTLYDYILAIMPQWPEIWSRGVFDDCLHSWGRHLLRIIGAMLFLQLISFLDALADRGVRGYPGNEKRKLI